MAKHTNPSRRKHTLHWVVSNETGLHVRAAAMLVKIAESIDAQLTIECGQQQANARSIMSLLALGAAKGTALSAFAEGPEADEMIHAVEDLFLHRFHESSASAVPV